MSTKDERSEHARALAELGAAKGGRARAKALTPEERREIARYAAEKRWQAATAGLPRETHTGILKIGDKEIPASVLDNGIRVFSTRGVTRAVGGRKTGTSKGTRSGAPQLPPFLASASIEPFISNDLRARLLSPLRYKPKHGGRSAFGYEASLLPRICEAILDAEKAGKLKTNQKHLADTAQLLLRGFAHVGIIALVDEATGYQADRARDALARILEQFIAKELRKWVKTFPADFYQEMFRLRGWKYADDSLAKPQVVGNYTNDIIYKRLAPGVLDELRRLTPRDDKGRLKTHFHRRLTEDIGHPRLREHLASVITIMKLSQAWDSFMQKLDRIHPRWDRTLSLPFPEASEA